MRFLTLSQFCFTEGVVWEGTWYKNFFTAQLSTTKEKWTLGFHSVAKVVCLNQSTKRYTNIHMWKQANFRWILPVPLQLCIQILFQGESNCTFSTNSPRRPYSRRGRHYVRDVTIPSVSCLSLNSNLLLSWKLQVLNHKHGCITYLGMYIINKYQKLF